MIYEKVCCAGNFNSQLITAFDINKDFASILQKRSRSVENWMRYEILNFKILKSYFWETQVPSLKFIIFKTEIFFRNNCWIDFNKILIYVYIHDFKCILQNFDNINYVFLCITTIKRLLKKEQGQRKWVQSLHNIKTLISFGLVKFHQNNTKGIL